MYQILVKWQSHITLFSLEVFVDVMHSNCLSLPKGTHTPIICAFKLLAVSFYFPRGSLCRVITIYLQWYTADEPNKT